MRILVPVHSFEPGGVERVALKLAQAWGAEGHQVRVLLGRPRGAAASEAPALDYVGYPEPFSTARWETIWLTICLVRHLLRERPDVIFCPGNTYTAVCVMAKLLLPGRCPPVVAKISNDLDPHFLPPAARPFYLLWLRIQGAVIDRFVAIAAPMRRHALPLLGVATGKVAIVADPAMDAHEYADLSRIERSRGATTHIVAAGRLVAQKNFALLLEAFARLPGEGLRLTIAGEGPERPALERTIHRLGLTSRVVLPGHVADVPALLAEADLVAVSSDYEGVPAIVIEALAAGLPVAATRCCASMGWLLGDGRFGTLARRRSPHSLAHAIEWALQAEHAADEARAHVAPFVIERGASDYIAAFLNVLPHAGPAPTRAAAGS